MVWLSAAWGRDRPKLGTQHGSSNMDQVNKFKLVDDLKSNGHYQAAGALSRILGHDQSYGCHFGMRSDLECAREAFIRGWYEADAYIKGTSLTKDRTK